MYTGALEQPCLRQANSPPGVRSPGARCERGRLWPSAILGVWLAAALGLLVPRLVAAAPEAPEAPEAPAAPGHRIRTGTTQGAAETGSPPASGSAETPGELPERRVCDRAFDRAAFAEAETCYRQQLDASSDSAETAYRLGLAQAANAKLRQAAAAWHRALALQPGHPGALRGLERLRLARAVERGLPEPAAQRASQKLLARTRALAEQRRCALALELLQGARQGATGEQAELAAVEGECLLALGRQAEAEAVRTRALSLTPSGAVAADGLARAALRRGDAAAATYYQRLAAGLRRTWVPSGSHRAPEEQGR